MRRFIFMLVWMGFTVLARAQGDEAIYRTLRELDSIGHCNSIAKHFGGLYFIFLKDIESQLVPADSTDKVLVRRFECVFAQFYIDASSAYTDRREIQLKDWQTYFSYPNLQPIQYKLLAANAHLNGGLWQALTNSFTKEEMKELEPEFHIFKKTLNRVYKQVYWEAYNSNSKVRWLHMLTLGTDELAGNIYLYKWRKRQMRLAQYYWASSHRFEPLLKRVNYHKKKIDGLVVKML